MSKILLFLIVIINLMHTEVSLARTGNETSGGGGDFLQRNFLKIAKKVLVI